MTNTYAPGSFGYLAQQHGMANPVNPGGLGGSVITQLNRANNSIAPNSPMLDVVASRLGVAVEQVRAFANGPEMSEASVKKLAAQIANETVPRGLQVQNRGTPGKLPPPKRSQAGARRRAETSKAFIKFVASHGMTLAQLASVAKVPISFLWALSSAPATYGKDHPHLQALAVALHVPLATMQQFATRPAKSAKSAKVDGRTTRHDKPQTPGVAVARVEAPPELSGLPEPKRRNSLKRNQLRVRQVARALASSANLCIMQGATTLPPLPVADLCVLLQDYFDEKGITQHILLDPGFVEVFDR